MEKLSQFKYAVQLQRVFSAGTFALNCAILGIPCIGYRGIDTQSICHPELSVKQGDLEKAIHLAKKLKNNQNFYHECSLQSLENYQKYFSEEVFLKHMTEVFS